MPIDLGRRAVMAGVAAVSLPAGRTFAKAARPLPQPDPALWHIDTPPVARGTATGPNGTVAYRLYGTGGGTPVIVLHGGPVAGETYMRPYVGLATDRRVVLYDQSGCGASASPTDLSRYTPDRYVTELEALRAALGFDRVVLLGHSWGGMLAPAYAAAHPDRVAALVLAGTAPRWRDFETSARHWLGEQGSHAVTTAEAGHPGEPAYDALTGAYYARHICRLDPWPAFLLAAGEALSRNPVYTYLNGPSEFQFTGALANLDVSAALRSIRVPTLVTCGEFDEAPPAVGTRVHALVPG